MQNGFNQQRNYTTTTITNIKSLANLAVTPLFITYYIVVMYFVKDGDDIVIRKLK